MDLNRVTNRAQEALLAAQALATEYGHSNVEPLPGSNLRHRNYVALPVYTLPGSNVFSLSRNSSVTAPVFPTGIAR